MNRITPGTALVRVLGGRNAGHVWFVLNKPNIIVDASLTTDNYIPQIVFYLCIYHTSNFFASIIMLVIPLKAMTRFDVMAPLAEWLDSDQQVGFDHLKPANPLQFIVPKPDFKSVDCRKDLLRLSSIRNCLADAIPRSNSHKNALEESALRDCHEYHAALLEFEKQGFPTLDDPSNGLHLTWKGAFAPQTEVHSTLVWDRACTLWNLAALETSLAADYDLSTKDGCKAIIQHCQNAASTLAILKELVSSQDFATVDMSQPMLQFWERFLVAQAQYCVYKVATQGDAPNHSILSYLSQGVVTLFNEALTNAQDHRLQSEVPKQAEEWGSYCKAQSMLASAKAEFHQAVQHRLKTEWGPEIARLTKCITCLEACQKFLKSVKTPLPEVERPVDALLRIASDRNRQAQSDNNSVYQDLVPASLEDIQSQILAKSNLPMPQSLLVPVVPLFVNVGRH
jgi:hypothetical protein